MSFGYPGLYISPHMNDGHVGVRVRYAQSQPELQRVIQENLAQHQKSKQEVKQAQDIRRVIELPIMRATAEYPSMIATCLKMIKVHKVARALTKANVAAALATTKEAYDQALIRCNDLIAAYYDALEAKPALSVMRPDGSTGFAELPDMPIQDKIALMRALAHAAHNPPAAPSA